MDKKVSIIIPNYNRAHLILYTLKSIENQDYQNWECLIIDDHSTDNSIDVIENYIKNDKRFKLFIRPAERPKGANACRNFGFELSEGYYIQWFDSDDIMIRNHISYLVKAIEEYQVDFAVADSYNFLEKEGLTGKPYKFDRKNALLNATNFGKQKIGWITDDFLGKKEVLKNNFNENIRTDGDEYNFFTKFLHQNNNGIFVEKVLTYRRIHKQSLSNVDGISKLEYDKKIAFIKFTTYKDIQEFDNTPLIKWFLSGYMLYGFKISLKNKFPPFFNESINAILKYFGRVNAFNFIVAIFLAKYFGKGYSLLQKAREK